MAKVAAIALDGRGPLRLARAATLFLVSGGLVVGASAHAVESNLRVEPSETSLSSAESGCGFFIRSGWSLVRRINVPQAVEGQVVQAHVASDDFSGNHKNIDYNWFVYPDPGFRGTLAWSGNFVTGAGVEHGRIECEWEIAKGDHPGGLPSWAWPTQGDRVYVLGSWILDCGHRPFRAEIHAPRLLVTYRNAAQSSFARADHRKGSAYGFAANGGEPTAATRADVFASSYGGESVESEYDNEDINLSDLYPSDVGPRTWWQPVNDRHYHFTIKAPPRPSARAVLVREVIDHHVAGATGPELIFTPLAAGDGYAVTIPFRDWPDPQSHLMIVGKTVFVGWAGLPSDVPRLAYPHLRHYRVTLKNLHVYQDLDPSSSGEYGMYAYVNEVGASLLSGDDESALGEKFKSVDSGDDVTDFNRSTFDVTLVDGQPLRVHFRGVEYDPEDVNNDAGTAEDIFIVGDPDWVNMEHTAVSGNTGRMGEEDEDPDCPDRGCYSVKYQIDCLAPSDVPPVVACPSSITVECTGTGGVPASHPAIASFLAGAVAIDDCGVQPPILTNAPAVFALGTTAVSFAATDADGNTGSCAANVNVVDTTPPTLQAQLSPTVLWPPNHDLVWIHATALTADVCDPNVRVTLDSIACDEPGKCIGDVQDATVGTADFDFRVRSERNGGGNGRVYTVCYTATDASGNATHACKIVTVPHDRSGRAARSNNNASPSLVIFGAPAAPARQIAAESVELGTEDSRIRVGPTAGPIFGDFDRDGTEDALFAIPATEGSAPTGRESKPKSWFAVWEAGGIGYWAPASPQDIVGAPERETLPRSLEASVQPNPAKGETVLHYGIPEAGPVRIELFDAAGRRVKVLVDESRPAGRHQVSIMSPGTPQILLYRVEWRGHSLTGKVVIRQ